LDECLVDSLLIILKVIILSDGCRCAYLEGETNPHCINLLVKNCLVPKVLSWATEKKLLPWSRVWYFPKAFCEILSTSVALMLVDY